MKAPCHRHFSPLRNRAVSGHLRRLDVGNAVIHHNLFHFTVFPRPDRQYVELGKTILLV